MNKRCFILILIAAIGSYPGCSRSSERIGKVSDVQVKNIRGGAKIRYHLPPGDSVQYIQATYQGTRGRPHQTRASFYQQQLTIHDLADTSARTVQLQAIGRGGSMSEPVGITIHPQLAPAKEVALHYLSLEAATGGVRLGMHNPTVPDMEVTVLTENRARELHRWHRYYSDSTRADWLLSRWPDSTQAIGIFLRDQGDVRSDTMFAKLDSLSWKGIGRLKNNIFPVRFARYDGRRWGTPAGWHVNKAARNQHGYGGDDRYRQPTQKGGYFAMAVWNHPAQNDSLINGKIWQTLRLPAGRYSFDGYFHRGTEAAINLNDSSSVWLAVARGRKLPDHGQLSEALGHAPLEDPHVRFTLDKPSIITVGFVANYVQDHNSFRCPAVALRRKQ